MLCTTHPLGTLKALLYDNQDASAVVLPLAAEFWGTVVALTMPPETAAVSPTAVLKFVCKTLDAEAETTSA